MWICGLKTKGAYKNLKDEATKDYPGCKILKTSTEYLHDILDIEDEGTGVTYRGYSVIFPILWMEIDHEGV